jgi:Ca2+:H+ antiporter
MAIVPLARLIVMSTEQIATRTGDAVGGLLNATFGNAPEMIIALVALHAGFYDMVRASIIGAILANLLLATGAAFFLGGLRHHIQEYNSSAARLYSSMMLISAVCLGVPRPRCTKKNWSTWVLRSCSSRRTCFISSSC